MRKSIDISNMFDINFSVSTLGIVSPLFQRDIAGL